MLTRLLIVALLTSVLAGAADEKAYLRLVPPEKPLERYIEVKAARPADLSKIRATLETKDHLPIPVPAEPSSSGAFRLRVPDTLGIAFGDMPTLVVEDESTGARFEVVVESEIRAVLTEAKCVDTLPDAHAAVLVSAGLPLPDSRDYAERRLETLFRTMQRLTGIAFGVLEVQPAGKPEVLRRELQSSRFNASPRGRGGFMWCFRTEPWNESSTSYKVRLQTPRGTPFELTGKLEATLSGINIEKALKADKSNAEPGTRTFERNLDLGALLSSAVKEGKRTTQGTLDLRFAPVLNWQATPVKRVRRPIWWWTPGFIDARVATGSITKDTLSTNTIVAGSEAEMRYYANTKASPDMFRTILRVANASDRDFKQAELKGVFEFQPLPGILWRPMRRRVDTSGKAPVSVVVPKSLGYEFKPAVGAELGRRYTSDRPAAPFPGSPAVRRAYFVGELALDLTAWCRITLKDKLYLRGEAWDQDRWHNWFNGEVAAPITRTAGHHVFVSFERGGQPPFATPDANTVKAGYRVVMDGWLGRTR